MRRVWGFLTLLLLIGPCVRPAPAQQAEESVRPWWIGGELGAGELKFSSDQSPGDRNTTFALGFVGGHSLGSRARIGMEVNGWLLQAFDLNNPTVGESVTNVMGIADVFPVPKVPFFFRGGAGGAFYTNSRPEGFNSSGWAWTAGAGYEIPVWKELRVAPMVAWSAGRFGDVRNPIITETGRRFSVVEFKLDILWRFGRPK
jgi:hypothetical protein